MLHEFLHIDMIKMFVMFGYGQFSLRLLGFAMFGATFNLVTNVGVP